MIYCQILSKTNFLKDQGCVHYSLLIFAFVYNVGIFRHHQTSILHSLGTEILVLFHNDLLTYFKSYFFVLSLSFQRIFLAWQISLYGCVHVLHLSSLSLLFIHWWNFNLSSFCVKILGIIFSLRVLIEISISIFIWKNLSIQWVTLVFSVGS